MTSIMITSLVFNCSFLVCLYQPAFSSSSSFVHINALIITSVYWKKREKLAEPMTPEGNGDQHDEIRSSLIRCARQEYDRDTRDEKIMFNFSMHDSSRDDDVITNEWRAESIDLSEPKWVGQRSVATRKSFVIVFDEVECHSRCDDLLLPTLSGE